MNNIGRNFKYLTENILFHPHVKIVVIYRPLGLDFCSGGAVEHSVESLGNTTATSIKTCSLIIAFLLEDNGDHKYSPLAF